MTSFLVPQKSAPPAVTYRPARIDGLARSAKVDLQGVPDGAPAIFHEKARNELAVKSIAGSTVEKDCTLSLYTARLPLNWANSSTPFGGQVIIPLTCPLVATAFGPSTTAPLSTGGAPFSDPFRFAT